MIAQPPLHRIARQSITFTVCRIRPALHAPMKHTCPGWRTQFASDNTAGSAPKRSMRCRRPTRELAGVLRQRRADPRGVRSPARAVRDRMRRVFRLQRHRRQLAGTRHHVQSYHSVICTDAAHIETDECGAPEFFSNGTEAAHRAAPRWQAAAADVRLLATAAVTSIIRVPGGVDRPDHRNRHRNTGRKSPRCRRWRASTVSGLHMDGARF